MNDATRRLSTPLQLVIAAGALAAAAVSAGVFWVAPPPVAAPPSPQPLYGFEPPIRAGVIFRDVAAQAGIRFRHFHGRRESLLPEDIGSGAAWGDYDNDGDPDLYVVNIAGSILLSPQQIAASPACNALYRNNGDGTFTEIGKKAGVACRGWGMGAAWGDFDDDGDLDLYVTNYGPNLLYRNDGDGTFTDVTAAAGVGDPRFSTGCAWGDYDRDGDLDLYVTNYLSFSVKEVQRQLGKVVPHPDRQRPSLDPRFFPPQPNALYRNNGDGTFTDVAREAGILDPKGFGMSASWVDLDGDGWLDLFVVNDTSPDRLYRNLRNGRFAEVSEAAGLYDSRSGMGLAVGDYDNDGDFDLYVTNWLQEGNALWQHEGVGRPLPGAKQPLLFQDTAHKYAVRQASLPYVGWGTAFFDYDNDGRLDLFVANGHTKELHEDRRNLAPMPNLLFRNQGPDRFWPIAAAGEAVERKNVARGAAFADYDDDGDTDIFLIVHGGAAVLLRNEIGQRNHWLKVRLRQPRRNRFAIGATVRITAGGVTQMRQVEAGSSYLSQNDMDLAFGLGQVERVERVEIAWPDGQQQVLTDVAADQTLKCHAP